MPIKNYSSGMYMRLGFAIAANLNPDILLLDEIFAVGDADFQQRCTSTVKQFVEDGKTIIFVSHAPSAIRSLCRRVCVLEHGELVFDGDVETGARVLRTVACARRGAHGNVNVEATLAVQRGRARCRRSSEGLNSQAEIESPKRQVGVVVRITVLEEMLPAVPEEVLVLAILLRVVGAARSGLMVVEHGVRRVHDQIAALSARAGTDRRRCRRCRTPRRTRRLPRNTARRVIRHAPVTAL